MKPTSTLHIGLALAVTALGLGFASCSDDEIVKGGNSGGRIAFNPALGNGGEQTGRAEAAAKDGIVSVNTLPLEGADSELFVHAITTEGIDRNDQLPDSLQQLMGSRAATNTADNLESFALFSYALEAGEDFIDFEKPNYIYNEKITRSDNWTSDHFWPGNEKYSLWFAAFAPYQVNGLTLLDDHTTEEGGFLTLDYTLPTDLDKQQDLLCFTNAGGSWSHDKAHGNSNVRIDFSHALTAVGFKAAADMLEGTITNVKITNLMSHGQWELTMKNSHWQTIDGDLITLSKDVNVRVGGGKEVDIVSGSELMMVFPHSETPESEIIVTFTDDLTGTERTLKANIYKENSWENYFIQNHTITFTISASSIFVNPYLYVKFDNDFIFRGETRPLTVTSYVSVYQRGSDLSTQIVDQPWETEYSYNDGATWVKNAPSWLTNFPASGQGGHGNDEEKFNVTVAAQTGVNEASIHDENLKTGPGATSCDYYGEAINDCENPQENGFQYVYNLEDEGNRRQWRKNANCYIITAPGHYGFYAYYGKSWDQSHYIDPDEFAIHAPGDNMLTEFIDHKGDKVDNLTLMSLGAEDQMGPRVLWSDAPDLVTDLSASYLRNQYGGGQVYINFQVKRDNIRQGNAVIGIYDASGQLRWSWHIWVTDKALIETPCQAYGYEFMPVPLGWVEKPVKFEERKVKVRITQTYSGRTNEFYITQEGTVVPGYCPTYQFGRKDPMPAIDYVTAQPVPLYNVSLPTGVGRMSSDKKQRIIDGICNPTRFYTANGFEEPFEYLSYLNLWDNKIENFKWGNLTTPHETEAMVYDPCPVDWEVPSCGVISKLGSSERSKEKFGWVNKPTQLFIPFVYNRSGNLGTPITSEIGTSYLTSTARYVDNMVQVVSMDIDLKGISCPRHAWVGHWTQDTYPFSAHIGSAESAPIIPCRKIAE